VSLAGGLECPSSGLVDVDVIVMGSDGAHRAVWGEGDALVPFLWLTEGVKGRVQVGNSPDLAESAIGGNHDEVFVAGDSSRLLSSWEV